MNTFSPSIFYSHFHSCKYISFAAVYTFYLPAIYNLPQKRNFKNPTVYFLSAWTSTLLQNTLEKPFTKSISEE